MTTKTEKQDVLYLDELKLDQIAEDLEAILNTARQIAEIWNRHEILPKLDKKHFEKLLSGKSEYIESKMKEAILSSLGKAGNYMPVTAKPDFSPHGQAYFDNSCSSSIRSRYINMSHIDFDKSGQPFISDATRELIRAKATAYSSDDNVELLKAIESVERSANKLYDMLRERGWQVDPLRDGLIQTDGNHVYISKNILTFGNTK